MNFRIEGCRVLSGDTVVAKLESNAAAWRWLDRRTNEHLSPKERTTDWSVSQYLKSSA